MNVLYVDVVGGAAGDMLLAALLDAGLGALTVSYDRFHAAFQGPEPVAHIARAAEMLGASGQIGVIAPGAYADVIAVEGDPVRNVGELEQVGFVMKDGRVYTGEGGIGAW